jgi:uncharacterized lipoprotein YmbA
VRWLVLLALPLLLAACGADDSEPACAKPDGVYLAHAEEVSGTCGPQDDRLVFFRNGLSSGDGAGDCTASQDVSDDHCTFNTAMTCVDGTAKGSGAITVTWNAAGTKAQGTIKYSYSDEVGSCSSIYRVTYTFEEPIAPYK